MIRRIFCLAQRHRWQVTWDYFAGVVHISARCRDCGRPAFEAIDLMSAGVLPGAGGGVEYASPFGPVGPILWDDQRTWSSGGGVPPAQLTYHVF